MATRFGMDAKLYYSIGGIAGGSWVELGNATDVTFTLEAGEADVTTRQNDGWRATVATLREASVEFEMIWDTDDPGFAAILNAYLNNQVVGMRVLDGEAGSGLQADMMVTNMSRSEPLEEAIKANVTLKVTRSDTAPSWISG